MSGSQQQLIQTTSPQMWVPFPFLIDQSAGPPNALIGAGAALTIQGTKFLLNQNVVLVSWIPPDPQPTLPRSYGKIFTPGGVPFSPSPQPPAHNFANIPSGVTKFGAIPVYTVAPTTTGGLSPRAGVATRVVTGGVAVVAIVGPVTGGQIVNGNAAAQGVTAENLSIDMTGPCLSGDTSAVGTTFSLATSSTFTLPGPLAPGVQVWVNAVTSGHNFSVVVW